MEPTNNKIPGLDAVGRGLYLRPHHPYELKPLLFEHGAFRPHISRGTEQTYDVPEGFEVDESPPNPNGVALNMISIEESWERFHKQRSLDAGAAGQGAAFSVSANMNQGRELRSEQESYYAVRSSFIATWSVYVADPTKPTRAIDTSTIPTPFRTDHRQAYETFFQRYGTHFVKRAWVGGKADVVVTVAKSSNLNKSEIQAGLKASFGLASGEFNAKASESRERLHNDSRCTVLGRGGDQMRLAAMGSLDEKSYNEWVQSIRTNPETIEIEIAGIWTLLSDQPEKAEALRQAYQMASTFQPISSVFMYDDRVYFLRGRKCFTYDAKTGHSTRERPLIEMWPDLERVDFERVDAAFQLTGLDPGGRDNDKQKIYMFRRDQYASVDIETGKVDEGYPRSIQEDWPGITFKKIDAVAATDIESIYFFSGSQYIRFNGRTGRADEGYPQPIQRRWQGVTLDRVDAACYWGGGKLYFFRDDQHIRYDIVTMRADPGYPKPVVGDYVEDWKFF